MVSNVSNRTKIEEQLKKIKDKEKFLREKEKKSSQKRLFELGRLFVKAQIAEMNDTILFGAFLEISERTSDKKSVVSWEERAAKHGERSHTESPIAISFKTVPSTEIKLQLKNLGFKWNNFRGEYYGHAEKEDLKKILKDYECKIEVLS